ncbi:hypothetical protein HK104_007298, partial [Borealophlyctis nickersoniae]
MTHLTTKFANNPSALLKQMNTTTSSPTPTRRKQPSPDTDPFSHLRTRARARTLWHHSITHIRLLIRASRHFSSTSTPQTLTVTALLTQLHSSIPQRDTLTSALATLKTRDTEMLTAKIAGLLAIPVQERTAEDERALDAALCRLPSFAAYSKTVRRGLARCVKFEAVDAGRCVVRAGHKAEGFYFLVGGKCECEGPGASSPNGSSASGRERWVISGGDAFGEFERVGERRKVTVVSLTPIEILKVTRDDYFTVLGSDDPAGVAARVTFMRGVGALKHTPLEILTELAKVAEVVKVESDSTVVEPGVRDYIYFLMRGQCRVMRTIPFIKPIDADGPLAAYTAGTAVPEKCEVTLQTFSIGDVVPGDYFPRIGLLISEALEFRARDVSARKVGILLRAMVARGAPQRSSHTSSSSSSSPAHTYPSPPSSPSSHTLDPEHLPASLDTTIHTLQPTHLLRIPRIDLLRVLDE